MSDFKTRLKAARLPESTVAVCLRGDLAAEFEDLDRQLTEVMRAPGRSLDDGADLAARLGALREQMREETTTFRLRAMPGPRWRQFVAEHPPRQDDNTGELDERDKLVGVNVETFYPALIRASVVEPALDDEDWDALLGEDGVLTSRQFDDLANVAWGLNRREVDVPFSRAASRLTRPSEIE